MHFLLEGDRAKIPAAVAFYRERYGTVGFKENMVYPGIEAALEALRAEGARLYVATSKPAPFAEKILAHFGLARHFPASMAAGSTAMVGDRSHDVAGASANGLRAVGALWGYGSRAELSQAGAHVLCERPAQLPGILSSLPPT